MDLQDGSGSETSEQSLQKLQSETDIQAATGDIKLRPLMTKLKIGNLRNFGNLRNVRNFWGEI